MCVYSMALGSCAAQGERLGAEFLILAIGNIAWILFDHIRAFSNTLEHIRELLSKISLF